MGILSAIRETGRTKKLILTLILLTPIIARQCRAEVVQPIQAQQHQSDQENIEKLPFCGEENDRSISRRLLYVTTLDGKLTALDVSKDGNVHWSIRTAPGPLLSSSIHRLELTNNGQWVRMIPSLSGGLYKFDGDSIDPIPITAENLLSSSFKFSDDLVISGGKETRSYGVSARTGQVLYECSMHGCLNATDADLMRNQSPDIHPDTEPYFNEHDPMVDDVVVVRRQTQTVRAVEPRTGTERWNFSVGHHELELLRGPDCHERPITDLDMALADLEIKVVVPEGIICAFSRHAPGVMLWKHKFDHPVVSAWQTDLSYELKTIDLFNSAQWIWNGERERVVSQEGLVSPSIYLGMFQKQLYIQESHKLQKMVRDQASRFQQHLISNEGNLPRIPWKPYPATSDAFALIAADNPGTQMIPQQEESADNSQDEKTSVTALSVLYASEYVNGNGFYLYSSKDLNKTESALCDTKNITKNESVDFDFNFTPDDGSVKVIIVSLWFWWKEILVISLTSALVINLLLAPKVRHAREVVFIEKHIPVPTAQEAIEDSESRRSSQRSLSESNSANSENFTSRFLNDFDLIQCLGKGGFGVVFEAKNKIDDVNYAIKRIVLPNKKESRDRVMREVKTLANCEHQNIVRYFQAWVETPPPGWQEVEDKIWMERNILSTSIDIETPDGTTLPSFPRHHTSYSRSVPTADIRSAKLDTWVTKLKGSKIFDLEEEIKNGTTNTLHDVNDDDDSCSFIKFQADPMADSSSSVSNSRPEEFSQSSRSFTNNNYYKNKDNDDHSDSFEIEFKHSSGPQQAELFDGNHSKSASKPDLDSVFSSEMINGSSFAFKKKHGHSRRPLSLDLSSKGNVIVPIPPKCQSKVYLYIQMQLCRKQSLREWLREHRADTRRPQVRNVFEQIVGAVDYVHLKGLIHRDLKPSNIFFSLDGQIKIGDFGLVTDMPDNSNAIQNGPRLSLHTQQVGTHLYMSPEQLQGLPYDFKVDIFSLGLIFFELLVDFGTEMERIETLRGLRTGRFPDEFQVSFTDQYSLLKRMLASMPHHRPTTIQIQETLPNIHVW